jgi:hypothetical protein
MSQEDPDWDFPDRHREDDSSRQRRNDRDGIVALTPRVLAMIVFVINTVFFCGDYFLMGPHNCP